MIFLGLTNELKNAEILRYCSANEIKKVYVFSPGKFKFQCSLEDSEHIEWSEIILYRFYYRLLQEIDNSSLIVINECLRTQNRNDLTYNCLRNYLNQTKHQLVFQYLPLIDTIEDFMILFDFDTRSRWKLDKFDIKLLIESEISTDNIKPVFNTIWVETDAKIKDAYLKEKRKLIDEIGLKDPHTIPRNLYLISGKSKMKYVNDNKSYVGRNNRFKIQNMHTFKDLSFPGQNTVFEFCHNYIDFISFMTLSRQTEFDVLTADLKVDEWYFNRYREWSDRISDAQAMLQK